MDIFVKTEVLDIDSVQDECILCDDGKKFYNLLINHFRQEHGGKKRPLISINHNSSSNLTSNTLRLQPLRGWTDSSILQMFRFHLLPNANNNSSPVPLNAQQRTN